MTRNTLLICLLSVIQILPLQGKEQIITTTSAAPIYLKEHFYQFKNKLEKNFIGKSEVVLLINGESGSEENSIMALRRGRIQISVISIGAASSVVPEFSALTIPFLFNSDKEADYILDNHLFDSFNDILSDKNLVLMRWLDSGWSIVYGKKPIVSPKDTSGYRIRSPSSVPTRYFFESFNTDVIQLPFSEIIPSLQTGLIEGGITSVSMYLFAGIYEHAPFLTLTNHALNPGAVLANKEWFDSLSNTNKKAVLNSFPKSKTLRFDSRKHACSALKDLLTKDVDIIKLSESQKQTWSSFSESVKEKVLARIGGQSKKIYNQVINGKREFYNINQEVSDQCIN